VRTVLLNALGGVLFGWLFWRRSLEVAMVAHAAFHVGLFVLNAALLLL
jgi:membrane protease YdiL (CAAX protease family)